MKRLEGSTDVQYQERKGLDELLGSGLIQEWKVAIDGGAHVGTWTDTLRKRFKLVHAFESGPAWEYLERNGAGWENVTLHHAALAEKKGLMEAWHRKRKGKMTSYRVRPSTTGTIPAIAIDSLNLPELSLLKLDIEGYEEWALRGALKTIKRCRPFILVEMFGNGSHAGSSDKAVEQLLNKIGYVGVWKWGVDRGFIHAERSRAR